MQLFYAPDITLPEYTLSEEESRHAIKVLRKGHRFRRSEAELGRCILLQRTGRKGCGRVRFYNLFFGFGNHKTTAFDCRKYRRRFVRHQTAIGVIFAKTLASRYG